MDASTVSVVISSHVVYLTDISLRIVLFDCRGWWWQLNENCINFTFVWSEKINSISLKSWIFEIGTHFNQMGNSQCRKIMFTPFVPPICILQGFSDLSLVIIFWLHISYQWFQIFTFNVFICSFHLFDQLNLLILSFFEVIWGSFFNSTL